MSFSPVSTAPSGAAPPQEGAAAVTLDLADPSLDAVELTRRLCDINSVSGCEQTIADAVEAGLRDLGLRVLRDGDAVLARTDLGRAERVLLAGHLDTVPLTDPPNLPVRRVNHPVDGEVLLGRGTCDMKGGVAVALVLAREVAAAGTQLGRDVTFVFYDNEEVEASRNGLGRWARHAPADLEADFAILLEPSAAVVEGGCNGTLRAEVTTRGRAAHSARAWRGSNAIHSAAGVLTRLATYVPREVAVEGLVYRECLNAVGISGGIATNVIPDRCVVTVNYRFAPSASPAQAEAHVREVFAGYEVTVTDAAPGALPGLDRPAAADFVTRTGAAAKPKYGWTDVARFSALGVPAVNYGPGDNVTAHADDERCPVAQIETCVQVLRSWLLPSPDAATDTRGQQ